MMTLQTADVTEPFASAGRITAKGHRVVLDDVGAYIEHKASGRLVKLHQKGNVFIMRVQVMPDVTCSSRRLTPWTSI